MFEVSYNKNFKLMESDNQMTTRRRRRVQIDRDVEVVIVNFTSGTFFYKDPKTHNRYRMNNFGDEEYITIDELMTMKNRHRAYLENMWIVIVDVLDDRYTVEDVMSFLRLENACALEVERVDEFIYDATGDLFERVVSHTGTAFSKRVCERTLTLYREGSLRDMNKVYTIAKLTDNMEMLEDKGDN